MSLARLDRAIQRQRNWIPRLNRGMTIYEMVFSEQSSLVNMKSRAHLIIHGKVQGVYYRAFTKELADSLGLKGWVKNLPDRSVEAVFEGDREIIEIAVKKCHVGPPFSMVANIELKWEENLEGFSDFRIRY